MKAKTVYTEVPEIKKGSFFGWLNPVSVDLNVVLVEKQESVYVFTKEQLEERDRERDQKIAGNAFEAGVYFESDRGDINAPSKSQYLANIKTQQP